LPEGLDRAPKDALTHLHRPVVARPFEAEGRLRPLPVPSVTVLVVIVIVIGASLGFAVLSLALLSDASVRVSRWRESEHQGFAGGIYLGQSVRQPGRLAADQMGGISAST
jgi:hypothetical protein